VIREEGNSLYEPEDDAFVKVTSEGGHIGRFYWYNQDHCKNQLLNEDGTIRKQSSWEIPGTFAFVWSFCDYIAFIAS